MVGLENPLHIAIILIVVLLVFGAKRLPEMGKSMGTGLRGFKQALSGDEPAAELHAESAAPVHAEPAAPVQAEQAPQRVEQLVH
jgi:sec-independent protein translocase protein TatA